MRTLVVLIGVATTLILVGCRATAPFPERAADESPSVAPKGVADPGASEIAWTVYADRVAQVKTGMTEAEVRALLGSPPSFSEETRRDGRKLVKWSYRRDADVKGNRLFLVVFEHGKVIPDMLIPIPEALSEAPMPEPTGTGVTWTLTQAQIDKVAVGMTESEVKAMIGNPAEVTTTHNKEGRTVKGWGFERSKSDNPGIPWVYIFFEHGRVTSVR